MRLDGFKEIFGQVLSEEDFSELERMIGCGLELEENSVSQLPDAGSKNLHKLFDEFPGFYERFFKIMGGRRKLSGSQRSKGFSDFVPAFYGRHGNLTGLCWLADLSFSLVFGIGGFLSFFYGGGAPAFVCGVAGAGLFANDIVHAVVEEKTRYDVEHYYHPFALPVSGVLYGVHRAGRWRNSEAMVGRRLARGERRLARRLGRVYGGDGGYSKKWFRREVSVLKDLLASADNSFKARFLQVEGRLVPFDKLELYRGVEECLRKEYQSTEITLDGARKLFSKFALARGVGVRVEELRERLLGDVRVGERECVCKASGFRELLDEQSGLGG